jgi:hypothetical protein
VYTQTCALPLAGLVGVLGFCLWNLTVKL